MDHSIDYKPLSAKVFGDPITKPPLLQSMSMSSFIKAAIDFIWIPIPSHIDCSKCCPFCTATWNRNHLSVHSSEHATTIPIRNSLMVFGWQGETSSFLALMKNYVCHLFRAPDDRGQEGMEQLLQAMASNLCQNVDPIAMATGVYLMILVLVYRYPSCTFVPWSLIVELWSKCDTRYSHPVVYSMTPWFTRSNARCSHPAQMYLDATKKSNRTDSLPN